MKNIKAGALILSAVSLISLSGCTNSKNAEQNKVVWYVPVLISGDGEKDVMDKVNELLGERYNLSLELIGIDSESYTSKMQVMNSGGEEYDLAFTAHWSNNYFSNVNNGVFREITEEEFKKYAPQTYNSMDPDIWDAIKVNGKIYGVPNWQVQPRASSVFIPEEYLEMTKTDIKSINTLEDITEYLRKIHKINPKCNKIPQLWTQLMPYYEMIEVYEENMPGAIRFTQEGKPEIINQYETQEFKDYYKLRRSWISEGLVTGDYLPDYNARNKEIKEEPMYIHVYKPGGAEETSQGYGYTFKNKQISSAILPTSGITAAMTGISSTSKKPENALKMVEIINTDKEINNLISYGLEGKDYDKVSGNKIRIREDKRYSGIGSWRLGSIANTYLLETQSDTLIEETHQFNEGALKASILGFNADLDDINLQISNCKTVVKEYLELIDLGVSNEEKFDEFIAKLKTAGVDDVIAELQLQVDEWWNNRE